MPASESSRRFAVIVAVDREQHLALGPFKVTTAELPHWASQHLTAQDQVAFELTTNAWSMYDLLAAQAGRVVVTNPYKTKLIAEAYIKNDKVDALTLARLLAAGFTCEVWVPDRQVREQRALAHQRARLQREVTRLKNRIHTLLHRHNLTCPTPSLFTAAGQAWLTGLALSPTDALQLRHWLGQLGLLHQQLDQTDQLIACLASQDPRIPRVMQLTGIGYYTAFAILAAIGNIQRFATPDQLTAYAGLVPRQHQSGQTCYFGHITKAGNPLLRWLMVEAARSAVRWDAHWRQLHNQLARRRGSNIAVVAVARKLLVTIWYLLTDQSLYHHLQAQTFVTKLQDWAYRLSAAQHPIPSVRDFVTSQLGMLGLTRLADGLVTDKRSGRLRVQPTYLQRA